MKPPSFTWQFLMPISSLLLILSFYVPVVSGQCLSDQQSLLLHLKNSLVFNDSLSTKLVQWHKNTGCCSWEGVTCSEGRVIGLDLSSESISGGLDNSSSLFSLHHLQNLSLAFNDFHFARIPSGFGKLTNLRHLNLSIAGFAGQIPIEISHLRRLVLLDLSAAYNSNYFSANARNIPPPLKLGNPNLEMLLQNFTELMELNLDGVQISAPGNEWCQILSSSLPNLRVMSLSKCDLSGPLDPSLLKLQSLSSIRLDDNDLYAVVPDFFANFTNLTSLSLRFTELFEKFPEKIFQLPKLEVLDLSYNYRLRGSLPDFHQNGNLRALVLRDTNFTGILPHSICNLTMLSTMDVPSCNFRGSIPTTMANLTQLLYLDMSFNSFTGPIPSFSKAKNLEALTLRYNSLNGSIPVSLFSLSSLMSLDLSNNQFSGQLNQFPNISSNVLEYLDLSSNHLKGEIPASIFDIRGLRALDLSSNNLSGSVQLNMVEQWTNLSTLDLSYNSLSIEYDRTDPPYPSFLNIDTLKLASTKLKTFPEFLKNQSELTVLDLSDNEIGGGIPIWIWELPSLVQLNLSFNNLVEGFSPNLSSFTILDIRSNRLEGQLPVLPPSAIYLDFSRNNFSSIIPSNIGDFLSFAYFFSLSSNKLEGSIPTSICQAERHLQVLDLSYNSFSGMIPECLVGMPYLGVLNLGRNNLHGPIPDTFADNCRLQTLDLNGNQLVGQLPKSLANCTALEVFNIRNNHIEDIFPCYLNKVSMLRVLVLRSNKFSESIGCPGHNATFPMLQILDLAANNFTGKFPINFFSNWKAIASGNDEVESKLSHLQVEVFIFDHVYYQDTVTITFKDEDHELMKILTIFTSIDISCNNLDGEIPQDIGLLKSLYALNLSHNAFTGQIPTSLANLTPLESLDLSSNKLKGGIPIQLAENLIFLSVLNLSFNQLVGKIPMTKQFATFSEDSYKGNKGLCGFPLRRDCNAGGTPPSAALNSLSKKVIEGNFLSAEIGYIFGFGIVIIPLMFWRRWRFWYLQQLDNILCKIFPKLYVARKAYPRRIIRRNQRPRR